MYVRDVREEFFGWLRVHGEQVLVLANVHDVDALCAVKILQSLFKSEHIMHTVQPVDGRLQLIAAVEERNVQCIVLINCGATVDLVEDLDLDEDNGPTIFVADAHRPVHVCNVYNAKSIRLLMTPQQDEGVPAFESLFRDSDSEEDDDDDDEEDTGNDDSINVGRRRLDEASLMRRAERRKWMECRQKLLFDYEQFTFYGQPVSLIFFDLAYKLSKDSLELLWWAIVGATEHQVLGRGSKVAQLSEMDMLQSHVSRLTNLSSSDSSETTALSLSFNPELNIFLFRHWTLLESLIHTLHTATAFNVWSMKGRQRLNEYLAEVGIPLTQSKQTFAVMDRHYRSNLREMLEMYATKFDLDELTQSTFIANIGIRLTCAAQDGVLALLALMEPSINHKESDGNDEANGCFFSAIQALDKSRVDHLERGLSLARAYLRNIQGQVQNFIDIRAIASAGPFLTATIPEGSPESRLFGCPSVLLHLGRYTLHAHSVVSSNRRAQLLPLILSAPVPFKAGICLVVGIPPLADDSGKNLLGKAFEQALKTSKCRFRLDYFDTSIFQLRTEDRPKFLEALKAVLS